MTSYVPVPRPVVEALLTEHDGDLVSSFDDPAIRNDLRAALDRTSTPPWHNAVTALRQLRALVDDRGPRAVHELDQLRGTIRDELDKLDVTLHDEVAIYHGLVWTGLVTELARYGVHNGAIEEGTYKAVAEIAATIASALLEYVPREILGRG